MCINLSMVTLNMQTDNTMNECSQTLNELNSDSTHFKFGLILISHFILVLHSS